MQGWYAEYCAKTGQFCDQVKLKHSTKNKKTGAEIVYNVESSAGFNPEGQQTYSDNDIGDMNSYKTTTPTTTTSTIPTTTYTLPTRTLLIRTNLPVDPILETLWCSYFSYVVLVGGWGGFSYTDLRTNIL